jgi:Flp pilus assembly protein TadG
MIRRERRHRTIARRGATAVEAAFVLSIVLSLLMAVFEFGRVFMVRQLLDNASWNAARAGIAYNSQVDSTYNPDPVAAANATMTYGSSKYWLSKLQVQVYASDVNGNKISSDWQDVTFASMIAAKVEGDYIAMLPTFGILSPTFHMTSVTVMRSEGN